MSSQERVHGELTRGTVLLRSFGDEPARLNVVRSWPNSLEVCGADESKSIGYPRHLAYSFNESLYERLRSAFKAGDAEGVARLWEEGEPYRG